MSGLIIPLRWRYEYLEILAPSIKKSSVNWEIFSPISGNNGSLIFHPIGPGAPRTPSLCVCRPIWWACHSSPPGSRLFWMLGRLFGKQTFWKTRLPLITLHCIFVLHYNHWRSLHNPGIWGRVWIGEERGGSSAGHRGPRLGMFCIPEKGPRWRGWINTCHTQVSLFPM